jgi:hypothetical protein
MEDGGFTLVSHKSNRSRAKPPSPAALAAAVSRIDAPPAHLSVESTERLVREVVKCRDELGGSDTWARVDHALDELDVRPARIVCYGLGSPSASAIARHQLALLLLIRARSRDRPGGARTADGRPVSDAAAPAADANSGTRAESPAAASQLAPSPAATPQPAPSPEATPQPAASAYDPIFSDGDRAILRALGIDCTSASSAGEACGAISHAAGPLVDARERVLFYMPHCDRALYEAVLAANWPDGGLSRVSVLGNSFAAYAERVVDRASYARTPRLDAVGAHTRECAVRDTFAIGGVFNNLSLHTFHFDFAGPGGSRTNDSARAASEPAGAHALALPASGAAAAAEGRPLSSGPSEGVSSGPS